MLTDLTGQVNLGISWPLKGRKGILMTGLRLILEDDPGIGCRRRKANASQSHKHPLGRPCR